MGSGREEVSHLGNSGTQRVMAEPEGKPVQGNPDASVLECSLGSVTGTNVRRHAGGCGENSWLAESAWEPSVCRSSGSSGRSETTQRSVESGKGSGPERSPGGRRMRERRGKS